MASSKAPIDVSPPEMWAIGIFAYKHAILAASISYLSPIITTISGSLFSNAS